MQLGGAVAVGAVDVAGNKPAKIFHFANVSLQDLVIAKKSPSGLRGFAVSHRAKRKPGDSADEKHRQQA